MLALYQEVGIIISIIVRSPKGPTMTQGPKKQLYVSGPLTVMTEEERGRFREFYEGIGRVGEDAGYFSYLPHIYGDPTLMAALTPREIDQIDRQGVMSSHVMICYGGTSIVGAAAGAGIEVEMAYHANVPTILVYESEGRPSRLLMGNPSIFTTVTLAPGFPERFDERDFGSDLDRIANALREFDGHSVNDALPEVLRHIRPAEASTSA